MYNGTKPAHQRRVPEQLVIHHGKMNPKQTKNALPKHSSKGESRSGCKAIGMALPEDSRACGDPELGCDCLDNWESTLCERKTG